MENGYILLMAIMQIVPVLLIVLSIIIGTAIWRKSNYAYKCTKCGTIFDSPSLLSSIRQKHGKLFTRCPNCNELTWVDAIRK